MVFQLPRTLGEFQGLALLVAAHIPPEHIRGVRRPALATRQFVQLRCQCFWYFDDALCVPHGRFLCRIPGWYPASAPQPTSYRVTRADVKVNNHPPADRALLI